MKTEHAKLEVKNLDHPDETRKPPKTHIQVAALAGHTMMRATFEPGWKWSECIKPTAGTDSCMANHVIYILSGKMMVVMDDGSKHEFKPGDFGVIPPGHDAWIVGSEPCTALDFSSGQSYAK